MKSLKVVRVLEGGRLLTEEGYVLQNLPTPGQERETFDPEKALDFDYAELELRALAHMLGGKP